jgi:3-oxoacyl-[acyl-carrier-protein] synthase III
VSSPASAASSRPADGRALRLAGVWSVASALPDQVVGSAEVGGRLGVSERWIVSRTGVRERRVAREDERLSTFAAEAGRRALERAEVEPGTIDLVLVGTMTADEVTPNAAPLVARELGAGRAGAIDLGAACSAFLSGLAQAAGLVESGRAERVLVIGADLMTRLTHGSDPGTVAIFADGAGATVVGPYEGRGRIGPILLRADAENAFWVRAMHDERRLFMEGQDTYRLAVKCLSEAIEEAAELAGVGLDEIDLFVPHQANSRITAAVGERLSLDPDRVVDCIDRYGNTSAGSVPIALAEAEAEGRLEPGARVMLAAFGAGFTWGAGVLEW